MSDTAGRDTGVTAPAGFRAAGVRCGIRRDQPDLALVVSEREAAAAAVFTRNRVQAAPIVLSRAALAASGGRARAILINSGNANACTGAPGDRAARRSAEALAGLLGVPADRVLVASTGVIGQQLPVAKLIDGLPAGGGRAVGHRRRCRRRGDPDNRHLQQAERPPGRRRRRPLHDRRHGQGLGDDPPGPGDDPGLRHHRRGGARRRARRDAAPSRRPLLQPAHGRRRHLHQRHDRGAGQRRRRRHAAMPTPSSAP